MLNSPQTLGNMNRHGS